MTYIAAPVNTSMRRSIFPSLLMLPLLAGCIQSDEPLVPELKGRWAAPNASKLRYALLADRAQMPVPIPAVAKNDTDCREQYVIFDKKHGITLYMDQKVNPLFIVREVKRDGARLILAGNTSFAAGGQSATIELILRNGEVRFDDIVDQRGRSVRHDRVDNEQARSVGVTSIGDIFRLVLDLKPCRA
jgi:hypothetical protein